MALRLPKAAQQQLWSDFIQSIRKIHRQQADSDDVEDLYAQKTNVDVAIEQLNRLIKLKREGSANAPVLVTSAPTPLGSAGTPGSQSGVKRKRRSSISASPAPPAVAGGVMESLLSSVPSPGIRGGTPMSRELTGKGKNKDPYADQLPLRPGRRVAYRVPDAKDKEAGGDPDWILTKVVRSVNGDRGKYEVQDADLSPDDNVQTIYTATLRSLILLPDRSAPLSNSANPRNIEDYPPGTTVLAAYPDTTAFYRAVVISAPKAPNGLKAGTYAPSGTYKLEFVDDGGKIQEVDKEDVVLHPDAAPPRA